MTDSLTDLDGAILSLLLATGDATAYAVRTAFRQSPSEFWSGSAGAIYPAIARLVARNLVRSEAVSQGKRRSQRLSLTAAGRAAVFAWSRQSDAACGAGFDPFRVRARVWPLLPEADRRALFDEMKVAITARIGSPPPEGLTADDPAYAIEMGQQRARLDWLNRQS